MTVNNEGKIVAVTEDELFKLWLERNIDDFLSFTEYIRSMKNAGVTVCK